MSVIVYYISSHGLGHAARAMGIVPSLRDDIEVVVKTRAPAWFFRQATSRPLRLIEDNFDAGCRQTDAVSIDWPATFAEAGRVEARNRERLDDEVEFLKRCGARAVVSDIPALGLVAAARAGIPGLIAANFTWADIYERAPDRRGLDDDLLDRMREQYAEATLLLRTPFCLPMDYFPRVRDAPLIARKGRRQRAALCERFGLDVGRPIYSLYLGAYGAERVRWDALGALAPRQFVTMTPVDEPPPNLTVLPREGLRHEDVTASVDGVVAKPGYGICGECVAASTPLLYTGRDDFAEFAPMERDLKRWGGAVRMPEDDLLNLNLGPYLERLSKTRMDASAIAVNGGEVCARAIEEFL